MTIKNSQNTTGLPCVLAGPMLRRCTPQHVAFWLVTYENYNCQLYISTEKSGQLTPVPENELNQQTLQVGKHCFIQWIFWSPAKALPQQTSIRYDFLFRTNERQDWLTDIAPELNYDNVPHPSFVIDMQIKEVIHGSCRKPHHDSSDALLQVDEKLASCLKNNTERPNFLVMTGDQIYTDDVAGPMLWATHQVITQLGLFDETLSGTVVKSSAELMTHPDGFYHRDSLLPDDDENKTLNLRFWQGKKKPIFTSVNGRNHLITFAEVIAMYLLVWSPVLWQRIELDKKGFPAKLQALYDQEKHLIKDFAAGLKQVRRIFAHLPTYMIFDDHDVTDDWNLTRGWEEASYSHPFSKRIIGNAILAYLLCQGWGNNPQAFLPLTEKLQSCFQADGLSEQDLLIEELLKWRIWNYSLPTTPLTVVLDTRTQRWRSESNTNKPSGLMDWESLCDLQQQLIDQQSVILISPAPIYGVKLIEVIQRIFTFFGLALTVDAENWMAHRGTGSVILNIFRHQRTPPLFIILSGDVHYSFVYDVALKFSRNSPLICQITASGIKNQFPHKLLLLLDKLNRWIFHQYSPLNWLTRRRYMSIHPRKPPGTTGRTLLNSSGVGVLRLNVDCKRVRASVLTTDGKEADFN